MKVSSIGSNEVNNTQINNKNNKSNNPNFKGLMDFPGTVMQGLENSGFIGSFLVQDTLGMTVPRTRQGLYRNVPDDKKNNIKNLNYKEGAEVFVRESLSGPLLMFSPVAVLLLGKKFVGKSTFTNSSMLKRLGKNLTETVKSGSFENVKALKKDFYKRNVTDLVKNTTNVADKNVETQFIDNVVEKIQNMDEYSKNIADAQANRRSSFSAYVKSFFGKNEDKNIEKQNKKLLKNTQQELVGMFNDFHSTHSSDLSLVNRVKFDKDAVFSTDKTIDGMRSYASDALKNKNNIADITESYTNNFQKTSIAKRLVVNTLAAVSTIASVSVVPYIYKLINPVPPGALPTEAENANVNSDNKTAQNSVQDKTDEKPQNNQVAFTGKLETLSKHFEFNGSQLTPALMTSLAAVGLIAPRVNTAIKRAPEDPVTKKKDYSEVPEVLTRDVTSTCAVTFGVPMLSKAIISSYEHGSGFILQNRPDKSISKTKKVLDKLNPFSGYSPYGLKDLNEIYGNVNTPEKLDKFAQFVNENNGSLAKIFNTLDNGKEIFAEHGLNIKELSDRKDRKLANNTIITKMTEDKTFADKILNGMKKPEGKGVNNVLKRARALNSYTSFVATLFLVPAFLGLILPKVVYGLTEKRHRKMAEANANVNNEQNNTTATFRTANNTAKIDYSKLNQINSNQTFGQFKHS